MVWYDVALSLALLPVTAASLYLLFLAVAARRADPPPASGCRPIFHIVIPAHDEEAGIAATVSSVLAIDYPRHLYRVSVVADNCSDRTAEMAARAGSDVLVRDAPHARGKGQALSFAFDHLLPDSDADAFVVIDADTEVSPNLLDAFAAHMAAGALAVQADYRVRDADASWRTRLMRIAFSAFHTVRSLARQRLALSCGLRGNGMGFAKRTLIAVPHGACSVVEDLEYGIALGRAGVRVHYVPEASVAGEMCRTERNSRSQRKRWEQGRTALAHACARKLFAEAWHRRDPVLFDLAADLLVPPLARLVIASAAGLLIGTGLSALGQHVPVALSLAVVALAGVCLHVGRAVALTDRPLRSLADLFWAPAYVWWKLTLSFKRENAAPSGWVRTTRERAP